MELSLSGNALKTFHRTITCLARVGTELVLQSSPSQLTFHTINSSRSSYQSVTLKPDFFDAYSLSAPPPVQCSFLLKAVCSIFRTPVAGVDRLSVLLPSADASKVQFALECFNGMRKTYWITCNVEPDIQQLSLDKGRFRSSLVVRPRDLSRLLSNFQSSLQEITVIATEPSTLPSDDGGGIGGKAVELRSYIDPAKDNSDATLHTQLWIDPAEEFLQYTHVGDPVDVTFSMKELKAFLSFCEGCEVDIHLFFEKAGEPILLAPKFGLVDGSNSDFDATLVLATMLTSQLREGSSSQIPTSGPVPDVHASGPHPELVRAAVPTPLSDHASEHTRIWSELSASNVSREREAQQQNQNSGRQNPMEGQDTNNSNERGRRNNIDVHQPMDVDRQGGYEDRVEPNGSHWTQVTQHHPNNWLGPGDDDEDGEDDEFVQTTPNY